MFSLCRIVLLAGVVDIGRARLAAEQHGTTRRLRSVAPSSSGNLREEVQHALSSALGEGHGVEQGHLDAVRKKLSHTWESLPKNALGFVTRRSMRYAVHRYFLQTYHISIIGLETANEEGTNSEAALLTNFVPNYVRNVLEGKGATSGFSLADAVTLIAVLRQLIFDTSSSFLATVYDAHKVDQRAMLPLDQVQNIVSEYVLYWVLGQTEEMLMWDFENNKMNTAMYRRGSLWKRVLSLSEGAVQGFVFERQRDPTRFFRERAGGGAWHPLSPEFSIIDVQTMIVGIIHTFGQFWAPECDNLKHSLVGADVSQTGRLQLSDFHSINPRGDWEFTESADFLRQVGALDESSSWRGGRVIITNYMQATSNCVVLAPHYRVCCANECEEHMDELETVVGAPDATPEVLLSAIENISAAWYGDEDLASEDYEEQYFESRELSLGSRRPELSSTLRQQLHDISQTQGGTVPLHGRLFAQWLHYAFPHECPYPHKAGTINPLTPKDFEMGGMNFKASASEISTHYEKAEELYEREGEGVADDSDFMSQWDHEEELLAEHVALKAPWEKSRRTFWFMFALPGLFLCGTLYRGILTTSQKMDSASLSKYY
jgi:hypothetical protein